MNKKQMRTLAHELVECLAKPITTRAKSWKAISKRTGIPVEEMMSMNPRFQWMMDCQEDPGDGLIEASMLLSEASRKDFDYQEEEDAQLAK